MREIPLTQGQVALVDDEDYERLSGLKWDARFMPSNGKFYACAYAGRIDGKQVDVFMHRLLMGEPKNLLVDHKNRNTLDCQKDNLRVCTRAQNNRNLSGPSRASTTGIRGVFLRRDTMSKRRWRAAIRVDGRLIGLGQFDNKRDAARAYANANRKYFGEFGGAICQ